MDHDPSRRSYAPTSYAPPQSQQQSQTAGQTSQYATSGAAGRFRQSTYIPQSPTSVQVTAGAGAESTPYYGFQQGAQYPSVASLNQSPIQYAQDVHARETHRQQAQHFPQYQGGILYSMQPPQGPQTPQSAYEPQYGQRPNTASETMPTQFGVSQNTHYYLAGQPGPTSAAASEFPAPSLPSQYQAQEPYVQPSPSASQVYASAMMDPSTSSYQSFGQQTTYAQQQPQSGDRAFNEYQRSIRQIATLTHDGTLRDADQYLLHISQYLLGNAERLELTKDDQTQHSDRIRLFDEFNRAWLAALQRQLTLTEQTVQSGQGLPEPQSLMSVQTLERLAQELIKLCDNVERHGLVDYQMGAAEEEIIDLLLKCLDVLDPSGERRSDLAATTGASRSR